MDPYALYLSYHSNTEQSCLQSFVGWTTTMGRLLGSKMALDNGHLSSEQSNVVLH